MNFPIGEKRESFTAEEFDLESYIYFLMEDQFTGVLRVPNEETAEILIVDGNPFCAYHDNKIGDDAIKEIIKAKGEIEVYFLEKDRAAYAFHWYKTVKRNPLVSWRPKKREEMRKEELERQKLMKSLGIKKPSKKEIKQILESENMDFLVKD